MVTQHVYIDTNIWLAFYSYTKDDVEQLRKLIKLIGKGKLKLYVSQQVADEFYRNREGKLNESIRTFGKGEIPKSLPRYLMDYPEAADYEKAVSDWQKVRDALIDRAKQDALSKSLAADALFADVLKVSPPSEVGADIISKALNRRLVGNPPGKYPSLGDQINWEILLRDVPDGTDLQIVSKDGDFESRLIPGRADQFLIDEWTQTKKGDLTLHSELRTFFATHFPDIKLAADIERKDAIERLVNCGNFAATHSAIGALKSFADDLSWAEVDTLLSAAQTNSQIKWIGTDSDVGDFYRGLLAKFADRIGPERLAELEPIFSPEIAPLAVDDDEIVPF